MKKKILTAQNSPVKRTIPGSKEKRINKSTVKKLSADELRYRRNQENILKEIEVTRLKLAETAKQLAKTAADKEVTRLKLEAATKSLESMVDSITDGLLTIDHDWRYTYCNKRATIILHMPAENIVGKIVWDLFPYAIGTKFEENYKKAVLTGETIIFDEFYPNPINKWFECHCYPSSEGLSVYFQDITNRKKAEELKIKAQDQTAQIVNSVREPLLLLDENMVVMMANEVFYKNFKVNKKATIGKKLYDLGNGQWKIPKLKLLLEDILPNNTHFIDFLVNHTFDNIGQKSMLISGKEYIREPYQAKMIILAIKDISTDDTVSDFLLSASELRYRRLFETAQDGILLLDYETGMITDVNQFLINLLGYSKANFLGKHIWEIGFLKDIVASKENFVTLQTKKYIRYEDMPLQTNKGYKIEVEFVSNVYAVDKVSVIQCNIRDITERKNVERLVREGENRFKALFSIGVDSLAIHRIGKNGQPTKFIAANDALCKKLGYTEKELLQMTPSDIDTPESAERMPDIVRKLNQNKQILFETAHITKNGKKIPVEISSIIFDLDGSPAVLSSARDITERKMAEQKLLRFNESGLFGYISWNIKGRILEANDKFLEIVGYSRQDLDLGLIDWVNMTPPEFRHLDENSLIELKKFGINKKPFEKEYFRKDKTRVPILVSGAMLNENEGVAFILDITERKTAEQALQSSEKRFRTLMEKSPIAIEYYDSKGLLLMVNNSCLETFGIKNMNEINKFNLFDDPNISIDYKKSLKKQESIHFQSIFDFDKVKKFNLYHSSKKGLMWIDVSITPLLGIGLLDSGYLVEIQDITVRKRLELDLGKSEENYRNIYMVMNDGIVNIDENGKFSDANPAALHMLGLTESQFLGRTSTDARWASFKEDGSSFPFEDQPGNVALRTGIKQEGVIGLENPVLSGRLWIKVVATPYYKTDAFDEVKKTSKRNVLVTFSDITERKNLETALNEVNTLKDNFLFVVSHEIKSPLLPIRSQSQLLLDGDYGNLNKIQTDAIDMIFRNEKN